MANFARMLDRSAKTQHTPAAGAPSTREELSYEGPDQRVLYVWGSEEKASRAALRLAQEVSIIDSLHIVDVRELHMKETPSWLRGVPTLLSVSEKTIWEGTDCLEQLEDMAETMPQQGMPRQAPQQAAPHPRSRQAFPSMGQMPRQTMPDGTVIQQRMAQMVRGADEPVNGQMGENQNAMPQTFSDQKVSASDMQGDVDAILKRREMIFQQQQQQPPGGRGGALPTMDHRA